MKPASGAGEVYSPNVAQSELIQRSDEEWKDFSRLMFPEHFDF